MPGPYCTADDVLAEVRVRLNLAGDQTPPEHWMRLAENARQRAYFKLIGLLARRGYSVAAVDGWAGAATYNRTLAVAHAFLASHFARESLGEAARLELEQLDKELGDPDGLVLFDALGAVIAPDIIQGGAVYGRQPQVDLDLAEVKNW